VKAGTTETILQADLDAASISCLTQRNPCVSTLVIAVVTALTVGIPFFAAGERACTCILPCGRSEFVPTPVRQGAAGSAPLSMGLTLASPVSGLGICVGATGKSLKAVAHGEAPHPPSRHGYDGSHIRAHVHKCVHITDADAKP
jgi:hypothetical protein